MVDMEYEGEACKMSELNRHGLIDTVAISAGALFFPGYFRNKVESVSFEEHLKGISLKVPELNDEKEYNIKTSTLVGELDAAVRLVQWKGTEYPTVIYHHGAMEIPYDYGFKNIFPLNKVAVPVNLFLIRAPFHTQRKSFMKGMVATENWLAMMAVSIQVIEQVIGQVRSKSDQQILLGGTSLGGFVSNLHHIHFNSADVYTPLLAGLAMHDTFLYSVYRKAVDKFPKSQPELMTRLFDFQPAFEQSGHQHNHVFPLLGKYDAIVRFEVQRDSYAGLVVETMEKGHTTGALSYEALRKHMLDKLL